MKRREYQEKYMKNLLVQDKYKELETKIEDTIYLFEEVKNIIDTQNQDIKIIEDTIENVKEKIFISDQILTESNFLKIINYKGIFIGAGLGSFVIFYNPYLAVGSILFGCWIGQNKII